MVSLFVDVLAVLAMVVLPAPQGSTSAPVDSDAEPLCDTTLVCPQFCATCALKYNVEPYPKRTIPTVYIGWLNGSTYFDNSLAGPMLIPVEITSQDTDELQTKCAAGCTKRDTCGDWTIDWEVSGAQPSNPYPYRQGSFVDAQAQRMSKLTDRWAVLYLPPEDLLPGETRNVAFTAKIRDLCPEGIDQESQVDFSGHVKRGADGLWEVKLRHAPPNIPDEQQKECRGSSEPCELLGQVIQPDTFPDKRFSDLPSIMFVDEVRALTYAAKDCDRVLAECGIPGVFCSTFCNKQICDEISYVWWVSHVSPADTGAGEFEKFGSLSSGQSHMPRSQTVMFTATAKGRLRLNIQANSKTGDATVFVHDMEIVERKVRLVDHAPTGQHPIFLDGIDVTPYGEINAVGIPGVEWIDANDDGDATDLGDYNFPMAYTRGSAPQMSLFGQTTFQARCMPGAIITGQGQDQTPNLQFVSRMDHALHIALPVFLVGLDFRSSGSIPNTAGKFNHQVRWEVSYVPTRPVSHAPTHSYRLYSTLTAPQALSASGSGPLNSAFYRYWESAYDISCSAAQGATGAPAVLAGLVASFGTKALTRKAANGANMQDGVALQYWGEVATQPYPNTCQLLGPMLFESGSASNGVGTCQAFAQLFKLSLALHGQSSVINEFRARLPPRRLNGVNTFIAPLNPYHVDSYYPYFLVDSYNFLASTNDQAARLYFTATEQLLQAPGALAVGSDPDRGRTFHDFDMLQPHNRPWSKAVDLPGKGGMNSTNPRSVFREHALVEYLGRYYDPSYGDLVNYGDAMTYGAQAVDGVLAWDLGSPNGGYLQDVLVALERWTAGPFAPTFGFVAQSQY